MRKPAAATGRRANLPRPVRRLTAVLALIAAVTLLAAGCGGGGSSNAFGTKSSSGAGKGTLKIASAGFTESQILAEMYSVLLKKAGYSTSITTVATRELYEPALEKGDIDVVPEYAATMAEFLNRKKNGANAPAVASADVTKTVAALQRLGQPLGLKALTPSQAVDQNAFVVTKDYATKHHLTTLTDLGKSGQSVSLAAGEECASRPFCKPGLEKTYGIKISKIDPLGVDTVQTKKSVQTGKNQLGLALTTDGTLADFGLVVLADDKKLQNADNLVPVVGKNAASKSDVADALNKLAPVLTTADLAALNKKVDSERQKADKVAQGYLHSKGLA